MQPGPHQMRLTPQRKAVLDVLCAARDHPTAADLFQRVRQVHPGIGAATVYRTLALLVTAGLARELSLGDGGSARYDGNVARHDHLVCDRCGRAVDIDRPVPAALVSSVAARSGFLVTGYDLRFRGLCPQCLGVGHDVQAGHNGPDAYGETPAPPTSRPDRVGVR